MNYGVTLLGKDGSIEPEYTYYGMINDIIELSYGSMGSVVLFRCDWASLGLRGTKKDKFGVTLVNFERPVHTGKNLLDEPFIHAWQARQVYYVPDAEEGWHAVRSFPLRDAYDLGGNDEDMEEGDIPTTTPDVENFDCYQPEIPAGDVAFHREDVNGQTLPMKKSDTILSLR